MKKSTKHNSIAKRFYSLGRHWLRCAIAPVLMLYCAGIARAEPLIRPGDHIAIIGNTFADQLRLRGYLETLLLQRTQSNLSIRNLGWAGDMLTARDRPTNFPTEESTLIAHKTDVIIACFGMGESFRGEGGLADFKSDLGRFIATHRGKQYNGKSKVRLVLVSPIAYEDLGKLTPKILQRNRELFTYTHAMDEVAAQNKVGFVNLYEPSSYLMEGNVASKLTRNGIHLNAYGYWAVSRSLADALRPGDQTWRLRVDAKTMMSSGRGVEISDVQAISNGLSFKVKEKSWPSLGPPEKSNVHTKLAGSLDMLEVQNLPEGEYELMIDGKSVARASHKIFAQGIVINSSPAHKAVEKYRQAVNDKNLQYLYSFKALNQVHIVGERKSSNSGKALPAEVIEFDKLAIKKDDALRSGVQLKSRLWRLVRVPR